jgi:double zinc ribbon protein
MAVHDDTTVYGVSEACKYNDHQMCGARGCRCDCHHPARQAAERAQVGATPLAARQPAGPLLDKTCPVCKRRYAEDKNFCTADGNRLSSLRCAECGQVAEPEDVYCGYCGRPMKDGVERVAATEEQLEDAALGPLTGDNPADGPDSPGGEPASMEPVPVPSPRPKQVGMPIISVGMFK